MRDQEITISSFRTAQDYSTCGELQQIIWRSDPIEVIPAHLLITAHRHGGLLLGAYAGGQMIGFLFGFPGTVAPDNPAAAGPQWEHCSHIMGVLPEWQGRGVGYRLKLAQRAWAIEQGFDLVTWTFDPLEAGNGVLNLGKLGAICRCYLRDFYGQLVEGINVGLPTDRFEVAWWVKTERVRKRVEGDWRPPQLQGLLEKGVTILNPGQARADGWIEPGPVAIPVGQEVLVEIPARLQAIKEISMDLALQWRLNVRQACERAFAAGCTAADVVRAEVDAHPRVYYLLAREI